MNNTICTAHLTYIFINQSFFKKLKILNKSGYI